MKKIIFIILCSLLSSCRDDMSIHQVEYYDSEMSIMELNKVSNDTIMYKLMFNDEKSFNVYSSDNKVIMKDCYSTYGNNVNIMSTDDIIWIIWLIFLATIIITMIFVATID